MLCYVCFQVSLSAFSFLFSEIVQYARSGVKTTQDLETKYRSPGHRVRTVVSLAVDWQIGATRGRCWGAHAGELFDGQYVSFVLIR